MGALRRVHLLLLAALVAGVTVLAPVGPEADGEDIEAVRERALQATQELADAEARLGELDQQITTAEHQADEAQRRIDELQADVDEMLVQQYIRPADQLLLNGEDLSRVARADALMRIVTHGDADSLDAYQGAQQDLAAASANLADLRAQQEQAVGDLEQRQADLEAEIARLEELERQRRAEEERRRREAAAAAAAAAEAANEEVVPPASDGVTTPPPSGGGITCPVPGSTFVDTWGAPRGGGRSHEGVDMMASMGTNIYAPGQRQRRVPRGQHRRPVVLRVRRQRRHLLRDAPVGLRGQQPPRERRRAHRVRGRLRQRGGHAPPALRDPPGRRRPVNPYPATAAACF